MCRHSHTYTHKTYSETLANHTNSSTVQNPPTQQQQKNFRVGTFRGTSCNLVGIINSQRHEFRSCLCRYNVRCAASECDMVCTCCFWFRFPQPYSWHVYARGFSAPFMVIFQYDIIKNVFLKTSSVSQASVNSPPVRLAHRCQTAYRLVWMLPRAQMCACSYYSRKIPGTEFCRAYNYIKIINCELRYIFRDWAHFIYFLRWFIYKLVVLSANPNIVKGPYRS